MTWLSRLFKSRNRCQVCGQTEKEHNEKHDYQRDDRIPAWHGWHAARRGLGSNITGWECQS